MMDRLFVVVAVLVSTKAGWPQKIPPAPKIGPEGLET